ncbi:MAG: hypothetical protein IKN72_03630 [Clostridia bacterium]|nr:hypothetical protein [Clostridia bacterium]
MDLVAYKSSLKAVADEIRARNGSNGNLVFPTDFVSTIQNLQLPQSLGTVAKELKEGELTYSLPAGIYDGGRVFVQGGTASIAPSNQQQTKPETGESPLLSATVGGVTTCRVATGIINKSSSASAGVTPSLSITGLDFCPVGATLVRSGSGLYQYAVWCISSVKGPNGCYGWAVPYGTTDTPGARITGATWTFGENSVQCSGIVVNDPQKGAQNGGFGLYKSSGDSNEAYAYIVFGI